MKIFVIVSPDKLSSSMFVDFYQKSRMGNILPSVVDINCLNSLSVQQSLFDDAVKNCPEGTNLFIKYKTKRNTVLNLPDVIQDKSDIILKFEIYATEFQVIKGEEAEIEPIRSDWGAFLDKMGR